MSNYRRWRFGQIYFFTLVTYRRRPFLTSPAARTALREAFHSVREERPFEVLAIVLLPDHLHTVLELPHGDTDYSTRWRLIKSGFTRRWLATSGRDGSGSASRTHRRERAIWQRRFFEHTCRDDRDLLRCIDYVHINPVKHRLVERVRDWPWSSFHRYVRLGEYPPEWGSASDWYGDEFAAYE
ncbi:Transposase IS200 like protein [Maioricimonas rarisocia]|uniref:Transposase IS200 like protein n=1 Tax=Maioricimonas rarisocia TaxID=2528026 RepID=A0A517Z4D6_9PLAN|nr:transposase [Maioricimonas rarisocia]QDU37287.1 Transposase IS200 like protein [Maioricimonas rarisocia]